MKVKVFLCSTDELEEQVQKWLHDEAPERVSSSQSSWFPSTSSQGTMTLLTVFYD